MRKLGALLGILLLTLVGLSVASATPQTDPRLGTCAGPQGKVLVAFDMTRARDLWLHIPGFLKAPELETDDPAHVVVYDGQVRLATTGSDLNGGSAGGAAAAASRSQLIDNVVCVAIAGVPTYYSSVDLTTVTP
jgi:hypothetical protein